MSAPELRNYRVALVGYGVYAIWVTAESRQAACDVADLAGPHRGTWQIVSAAPVSLRSNKS